MKIYTDAFLTLNKQFLPLFYSYKDKTEDCKILFITYFDIDHEDPIVRFGLHLGHDFITYTEISNSENCVIINKIWLHTFGLLNEGKILVNKFQSKYSYYTDGLKNEYDLENCFTGFESILFFGYILEREGLRPYHQVEICSLRKITKTFDSIKKLFNRNHPKSKELDNTEYIYLRHWGVGIYKLRNDIDLSEAIRLYTLTHLNPSTKRIVLKGDYRINKTEISKLLKDSTNWPISVLSISKIENMAIADCDNLMAEIIIHPNKDSQVHCFDSSLSIFMAAIGIKKLAFPKRDFLAQIFENADAINFSTDYSKILKCAAEEIVGNKEFYDADNFFIVRHIEDKNLSPFKSTNRCAIPNKAIKYKNLFCRHLSTN